MNPSDGPPSKVMKVVDVKATTSSKRISDLPDTFIEQIFRQLDLKSLFVVTLVENTAINRCAHQVLSEVTHLAIISSPSDGKLDFSLLPGNAIAVDNLCQIKEHRFPKKNILVGFTDHDKNEEIVLSILNKLPRLAVLHLDIKFGLYKASKSAAALEDFEQCDHAFECEHRRLPSSLAMFIGRVENLVHVSLPRYFYRRDSDTYQGTQIPWKDNSPITCYNYEFAHWKNSEIGQFQNLKYMKGMVMNDVVLRSILDNGVKRVESNNVVLQNNLQFAFGLECVGNPFGFRHTDSILNTIVSNCKSLKHISFTGDLNLFKKLSGLQNLAHLVYDGEIPVEEESEAIACFKSFGHQLKSLHLWHAQKTNLMPALLHCPNLEYFNAWRVFNESDMEYIKKLPKLQFLRSNIHEDVTEEHLSNFLRSLPNLRFLEIQSNHVDKWRAQENAMLKNLKMAFPKLVIVLSARVDDLEYDRDLANPIVRFAKMPYFKGRI